MGKRLLLLGEEHSTQGICKHKDKDYQEVHEWLYSLSENSPTCLDIFVETYIDEYFFKQQK